MLAASGAETTHEILEIAAREGVRISARGLRTFSHRGLAPRARVHSLGRARGTTAIYPPGTAAQVTACELLRQKFGRHEQRIGWELWLRGYTVHPRYHRMPLEGASEVFRAIAAEVEEYGDDGEPYFSQKTECAVDAVSQDRCETRLIGYLRRTLREHFFSTLVTIPLGSVRGYSATNAQTTAEHLHIFGRFLGAEPASKKRRQKQTSFDVKPIEFAKMLDAIAAEFSRVKEGSFERFSEKETLATSQELGVILNVFLTMQLQSPSRAIALLRLIVADLTPTRHAVLVRVWQVAREIPTVRAGVQKSIAALTQESAFPPLCAA